MAGRIPTPEVEVVTEDGGHVRDARVLARPIPVEGGFFRRLFARARPGGSFALGEQFDLLSHEGPRPVLCLRPGMSGELRIGVSRVEVEALIADPALRGSDGLTRYPLPNGIRGYVCEGSFRYCVRVGGRPLLAEGSELSGVFVAQTA